MTITRTCGIVLDAAEVSEALTAYIRDTCRYRSDIKAYEECLAWVSISNDSALAITWGNPPDDETPTAPATPPKVDCQLAAK